jgi:hypothetical protein
MWFPKYKTKVMGAIQAEAQRTGIRYLEMVVINGGPVSQLERRTMPFIIAGAVSDLQKKGKDIGFVGEGRDITIFMRPMEYTEFFPRFHEIDEPAISATKCLDLSSQGIDPRRASAVAWWLTTDAAAGITSANLLHNPLGEGVHEIIEVFEQKEQLRTLCGFEEGIKEIDWKDSKKGPTEILLLAADLRACRAIATVNALLLSGNGLAGAIFWNDGSVRSGVDTQMDGIISLFVSLRTSQITMLDLSRCGLGPASMGHLADYLRNATAALIKVDVSGNSEIGGEGKTALQTAIQGRQPTIELVV